MFGVSAKTQRLLKKAEEAFRRRAWSEARALYQEALESALHAPHEETIRRVVRAYERFLQELGDEEERKRVYQAWLDRQPEAAEALVALARLLAEEQDASPRARMIVERALRVAPEEPRLLRYYAEILLAAGEHGEKVRNIVEKAVEHDRFWVEGIRFLLEEARKQKDTRREMQYLWMLQRIGVLEEAGLTRLAYLLARENRDDTESCNIYVEALRRDPGLAPAARALARKMATLPHPPEEWFQVLQRCHEYGVEDPEVEYALVKFAIRKNLLDRALIEMSERAATAHPEDPEVTDFAARNLPLLGSLTPEAQKIYLRYLEHEGGKDREWLERLIQLLASTELRGALVPKAVVQAVRAGVPVPRNLLARVAREFANQGRLEEDAIRVYEEAYRWGVREKEIAARLLEAYRDTGVPPEFQEVAEQVFREADSEGQRKEAARVLVEEFLRKGKKVLQPGEVLAYLWEEGDWTPRQEEWEILARHYLNQGKEHERALDALEGWIVLGGPKDAEERRKLLDIVARHLERSRFREYVKDRYKRGDKFPEVLRAMLQVAREEQELLFPVVQDALRANLPELEQVPAEVLRGTAGFAATQRDFWTARQALERIPEEQRRDADWQLLTKIYLALNRVDDAETAFRRARWKEPSRSYWWGRIAMEKRQTEEARRAFEKAQDGGSAARFARFRLGEVAILRGEHGEAQKVLYPLTQDSDLRIPAAVRLVEALARAGRLQEAEAYRNEITGLSLDLRQRLSALLRYFEAQAAYAKGDWQRAAEAAVRASKMDHYNRALWRFAVEVAFRAGLQAYSREAWKEAAQFFQQVLTANYRHGPARFYLAEAYHHLGDRARAHTQMEEVLRTEFGRSPQVRLYAGILALERGDTRAIRLLEEAWQEGDPEVQEKALGALVQAILRLPVPEDWKIPREEDLVAHLRKAYPRWVLPSFYLKIGRPDKAIRQMNRWTKDKEKDLHYLYFVGLAYLLQGDAARAVAFWSQILQLPEGQIGSPAFRRALFGRIGAQLLESGLAEQARKAFERMQSIEEPIPELRMLIAETYKEEGYQAMRRGEAAVARQRWEFAQRIYPGDEEVRQNLALWHTVAGELEDAVPIWKELMERWQQGDETRRLWAKEIRTLLTMIRNLQSEKPLEKAAAQEYLDFVKRAVRYYWTLGLDRHASPEEIERRYFRLLRTYGPERRAEDFMLLEEAYAHLMDEEKRKRVEAYSFTGANRPRIREVLKKYHIDPYDYLFWEEELPKAPGPLRLAPDAVERAFGELPEPEEVYPPLRIRVDLPDLHV